MMLEPVINGIAIPGTPFWISLFVDVDPTLTSIWPLGIMLADDNLNLAIAVQIAGSQ